MTYEHWVYLLLAVHVIDTATTHYGITHDLVDEGNPLISKAIDHLGVLGGLVTAKIALYGSMWYFGFMNIPWMIEGLTALGAGICAWNVYSISKAKKA